MRPRQVSLTSLAGALAAVTSLSVYAAAGDAQPAAQLSAGTLSLGAGGASALDVMLVRDGANALGQRNGTNAQTLAVYNTWTTGTPDSEKLVFSWSGNVASIGVTKTGTGTVRTLNINYGDGSAAMVFPAANSNSAIVVGSGTSAAYTVGVMSFSASYTRLTSVNYVLGLTNTLSDGGSSSSCIWSLLNVSPTISYSAGTKTGAVKCINISPVNTSLPTGVNAGLSLSSTASGLTGAIVYHNQTDEVTNAEYVYEKFNGNTWEIGSVKLGGGTLRGIRFGITGNAIGFMGATPVVRTGAYTLNATIVASRTLLANASATAANCNSVIAQMIQDLQSYGLFA